MDSKVRLTTGSILGEHGSGRSGTGERISSLLNRVITFDKTENYGRIHYRDVATYIFNFGHAKEIDSPLERCLRERKSLSAENAWQIGEALNALGVRWMSGLVTLRAARLSDYALTVARMLILPEPLTREDAASLWHLFNAQRTLISLLSIDDEVDLLPLHVGINDPAAAASKARLCMKRLDFPEDWIDTFERAFVAREQAKKKCLSRADRFQDRFKLAFRDRHVNSEAAKPAKYRMLQAAIATPSTGAEEKEKLISDVIASWLRDLENGE